jgi:hypothetical protein
VVSPLARRHSAKAKVKVKVKAFAGHVGYAMARS